MRERNCEKGARESHVICLYSSYAGRPVCLKSSLLGELNESKKVTSKTCQQLHCPSLMVAEMLQKWKFLLYILYLYYMKFYFDYILHIYVMFYYIFMIHLYVYYLFFNFCYIFLFSYYLILNLCDNDFIFIICTKLL